MTENEASNSLRNARLHAGLSQGDMAEKLGVTTATVSRIEAGLRGTPHTRIVEWYAACGFSLVAVPTGGPAVAEMAAAAFASIPGDTLYGFLGVMRAWPLMSDQNRRILGGMMHTWALEFGTALLGQPATEGPRRRRRFGP